MHHAPILTDRRMVSVIYYCIQSISFYSCGLFLFGFLVHVRDVHGTSRIPDCPHQLAAEDGILVTMDMGWNLLLPYLVPDGSLSYTQHVGHILWHQNGVMGIKNAWKVRCITTFYDTVVGKTCTGVVVN